MTIDVADVQGNVLRAFGRKYRVARHLFVGVMNPAGARRLIGELAGGDGGAGPRVSSSAKWQGERRPQSCLTLGVTWLGLQALGVPAAVLRTFPQAFQDGPAVRALARSGRPNDVGLGDVGQSAPDGWVVGGPLTPPIHLVLSLYAREPRFLDDATAELRARFASAGLTEHASHDAHLLAELDMVHFGYRDGIAQPQIDGGPAKPVPDSQPKMPAGDLLLGRDYVNSFNGNYGTDLPGALIDNATYGAFRILGQDAAGFEALLERWAQAAGIDKELVAAKIMGRWRNGAPLVLTPHTAYPEPPLEPDQLNDFDYVSTKGPPPREGDPDGLRCPVGAHIRRLNPRSGPVIGMPNTRRLVRRNMPYGPAYEDGEADGAERGLIGYFLCGDLEAQWEFVQRMWVNDDFATRGVRGTREPVGGAQLPDGGAFFIPTDEGRIHLDGLHDLVHTRGSLYCLLPGIGGLRHLASLGCAA